MTRFVRVSITMKSSPAKYRVWCGGTGGRRATHGAGTGISRFCSPGGSSPRSRSWFRNPGGSDSRFASPGGSDPAVLAEHAHVPSRSTTATCTSSFLSCFCSALSAFFSILSAFLSAFFSCPRPWTGLADAGARRRRTRKTLRLHRRIGCSCSSNPSTARFSPHRGDYAKCRASGNGPALGRWHGSNRQPARGTTPVRAPAFGGHVAAVHFHEVLHDRQPETGGAEQRQSPRARRGPRPVLHLRGNGRQFFS